MLDLISWADMLKENTGQSIKEDYSINIGTHYSEKHTNTLCKFISLLISESMNRDTKMDYIMKYSVSRFYDETYQDAYCQAMGVVGNDEKSKMQNIKNALVKVLDFHKICHKRFKVYRFKGLGVRYRTISDKLISGYPLILKYDNTLYLVKGYKVFSNNTMYLEVISNYGNRYKVGYINFANLKFNCSMIG